MTTEELESEIINRCIDIILNSEYSEWANNNYSKEKIKIDLKKDKFIVILYNDIRHISEHYKFELTFNWSFNRKTRKRNKLLSNFNKGIFKYFEDKKRYDEALKSYKLLPEIPLNVTRKKKLQLIDKNII
jgi:hypothetical protein